MFRAFTTEDASIMEGAVLLPLARWESFYVLIGSSAGALTGLQFVVLALIADPAAAARTGREIHAFSTPIVLHFCAALLISAIASMPWPALSGAGLGLGACGAAGILYLVLVIRLMRRQTAYRPDTEDWIWYAGLPLLAYAALLGAAIALPWHPSASLFVIAAAALTLLFVGIHNAWDTVTYVTVQRWAERREGRNES